MHVRPVVACGHLVEALGGVAAKGTGSLAITPALYNEMMKTMYMEVMKVWVLPCW